MSRSALWTSFNSAFISLSVKPLFNHSKKLTFLNFFVNYCDSRLKMKTRGKLVWNLNLCLLKNVAYYNSLVSMLQVFLLCFSKDLLNRNNPPRWGCWSGLYRVCPWTLMRSERARPEDRMCSPRMSLCWSTQSPQYTWHVITVSNVNICACNMKTGGFRNPYEW